MAEGTDTGSRGSRGIAMPEPTIQVTLPARQSAVRETLTQVMEGLGPLSLELEERAAVELVLAEALNNIIEHAYADAPAGGPIRLSCLHRADGLHVTIVDLGLAMPKGRVPLGRCQPVDVDLFDLPEGGFGWFLIRDLARDLFYARIGRENHLHFRLAVGLSDEPLA